MCNSTSDQLILTLNGRVRPPAVDPSQTIRTQLQDNRSIPNITKKSTQLSCPCMEKKQRVSYFLHVRIRSVFEANRKKLSHKRVCQSSLQRSMGERLDI